MRTTRVRPITLAVAFVLAMGTVASPVARAQAAGPGTPPIAVAVGDASAIRIVVEAQLKAFAADDAGAAFAQAAPSIRSMFGTAEQFMAMVRAGYPVVYRPASVLFLAPVQVQGQTVQGVQMTDAGGALWLAVYSLERQPGGGWKISGCNVQPQSGRMT